MESITYKIWIGINSMNVSDGWNIVERVRQVRPLCNNTQGKTHIQQRMRLLKREIERKKLKADDFASWKSSLYHSEWTN